MNQEHAPDTGDQDPLNAPVDVSRDPMFEIGGVSYGTPEASDLRASIIHSRNEALTIGDMGTAVALSHVIGLMHAMMLCVYPSYAELAKKWETMTGEKPQKYGGAALLDLRGVVHNVRAMEAAFREAWDDFTYPSHDLPHIPSAEQWENLNEGALRLRLLLDMAAELMDPRPKMAKTPKPEDLEGGAKQ